jgi:UDP-glucose 4-epimerase
MKRVAITGISGYIGSRLFSRLDSVENLERIVGIDLKEPRYSSSKLKFYCQDISKQFSDIFVENEVESAIHLAFVSKPTHDRAGAQQIDIGGSLNFLEACRQAQLKHILYLSSHTVYGAYPSNPTPLTEGSPLRPLPDFQYSWDKAETEQILHDFATSDKDVCLTVLRSCPVVGPNAADSVTALMFKPPIMIGVSGYDPMMQFVHEDDLVELIATFLIQKEAGIFNVAGDEEIRYSEIARLSGKRMLKLPERLLHLLMGFSWALHLQNESPTSGLEFIKYPPIVSTEKLKNSMGFQFRYSSREALLSFLGSELS